MGKSLLRHAGGRDRGGYFSLLGGQRGMNGRRHGQVFGETEALCPEDADGEETGANIGLAVGIAGGGGGGAGEGGSLGLEICDGGFLATEPVHGTWEDGMWMLPRAVMFAAGTDCSCDIARAALQSCTHAGHGSWPHPS